ncbi:hypothetical protein [Microbacterium sp. SLBN-146]|uniref:hypothetical protein n=1 Tax=Microbacterium sp. SLBN-146 TaxID=2768457 RepID=UPI0011538DD6|nr:hypothetical protein [Microbacterium sp. SLBN-146]
MTFEIPALLLARHHPPTAPRLDRTPGLHRIRSGVYVDSSIWDGLPAWERYRLRVLAVAQTWSDPVFALESAASLHGLPVFGEPRAIHLLSADGKSWRQGDVVVHGWTDDKPIEVIDGNLATSAQATAVALARVLPPAFGLGVADAVARRLGIDHVRVADLGRAQADRRGVRRLDWIQERVTDRAESAGESLSRAVIEWLGYDSPDLQVEFAHEGVDDRIDFFWRSRRTIGESDGYGKYGLEDTASAREALVREKRREDRLRRNVGPVARWEWKDAMRADPLDAVLRSTGLTPARARDRRMLATLRANPRSL